MKTYLLLILWAAVLCGCSKLARTEGPATDAQIPVCFQMECPQMDEPTKTLSDAQEKTVKDLNLYLFCKNATGKDEHIYSAGSANITRKLTVGDYDLFVIANAGGDLGNMTRAQAEQSARTIGGESELETGSALPMSAKLSFTVKTAMTVPVTLRRIVARIDLKLSVAAAVAGKITLTSAQIVSVPNTGPYFADNTPASVMNYGKIALTGSSLVRSFYLLENLQGKVPSITSQTQRNRSNAPARASYIHIEGQSSGKKLDYYVYLGENTTDDFNVRRNKRYTLNAVVSGENTIDTRVSSAELQLGAVGALYAPNQTLSTTLSLVTQNKAGEAYRLKYHLYEGTGTLKIDGQTYAQDTPIPVTAVNGAEQIPVTYTQAGAGNVRIGFTMTDPYGYALSKELTTVYKANNPIEGSVSNFINKECHKNQYFTLSLSENDYTGKFSVKCELVKGAGTLYYHTTTNAVADGSSLALGTGTHTFYYNATQVGETVIRFTVTDANGQTKVVDQNVTMERLTIYIRSKFTYGTQKVVLSGNEARIDSYIQFDIWSETPPLHTLPVTYKVGYDMTNTMVPPTTKGKPSQTYSCTLSPSSTSFWTRAVYNDYEGPKYYCDNYGNVNYNNIRQHGYTISAISATSVEVTRPDDPSVQYYCYGQEIVRVDK